MRSPTWPKRALTELQCQSPDLDLTEVGHTATLRMRRVRLWTHEEAQAGNLGAHVAALGNDGVVPILTPGEIS